MSMKEVKLKAKLLDVVGPLLKRLQKEVKDCDSNDETIKSTLNEIFENIGGLKKCLGDREDWETELFGSMGKIEGEIDMWMSESESDKNRKREMKMKSKDKLIKLKEQLIDLLKKADVVPSKDNEANHQKDHQKDIVYAPSYKEDGVGALAECMKELNPQLRDCLYSLSIFPENEKLKKRLLFYWWIGLGIVPWRREYKGTTEQYAEILFDELIDRGILRPDETDELLCNQSIKWCTIEPTIHKQLIFACHDMKGTFKPDKRKEGAISFYRDGEAINNNIALLNCEQMYLDSEDIKNVLKSNPALLVLQFGWWREPMKIGTQETKSKDHIEVDEINFLKQVGENVTYLSLRGISRIEELPQNIGKLEKLMILDLRACHNLDKLPEKPSSKLGDNLKPVLSKIVKSKLRKATWFKNLNHLDMSECYMLDHMPIWICELYNLEVLKGFVASGTAGRKEQYCRIADLTNLKKLRKLSIKMAKHSDDSLNLKDLKKLSVLTITWRTEIPSSRKISFPEKLEKLDIRCYQNEELAEPFRALRLKRLYIKGGSLKKLFSQANYTDDWKHTIETLRLRNLKKLQLRFSDLRKSFTNLKCVEYYECPEIEDFPKGKTHHNFSSANAHGATNDKQKQLTTQKSGKEVMSEEPKMNPAVPGL